MSKWSSIELFLRPVTKISCSMPASIASSTAYWISGRSTTGSISLGVALVAGRNRVPSPATGNTALRSFLIVIEILSSLNSLPRPERGPSKSLEPRPQFQIRLTLRGGRYVERHDQRYAHRDGDLRHPTRGDQAVSRGPRARRHARHPRADLRDGAASRPARSGAGDRRPRARHRSRPDGARPVARSPHRAAVDRNRRHARR